MGSFLTTASVLMCPHGGSVSATTSNTRVRSDGALNVRPSDNFTISGCPFTLPNNKDHPCVRVEWVVAALRSTAGGDATLTRDSVGMCMAADNVPQGTVQVVATQARGAGQ